MSKLNYNNYVLDIPNTIYEPSDDTYLLLRSLESENIDYSKSVLEIGSGNGIITLYFVGLVKEITAIDINPFAIKYLENIKLKYNLTKLNIIKSNLFENVYDSKFDVVVFNPPYVCSEEVDYKIIDEIDLCTNGGKDGAQIIYLFIDQLKNHLTSTGVCYLLISSQNKPKNIYKKLLALNFNYTVINSKKLFFEELFIVKITNRL